jgi:hypothetical protein
MNSTDEIQDFMNKITEGVIKGGLPRQFTDYWNCEDEFIQHDREQLYKQALPTATEDVGKIIIAGTPSGSNQFYNMWVLYQGGNFNNLSFEFKNKQQ